MRIIAVSVVFAVLAAALTFAQGPQMSAEERQAILNYQLTLPRADQLITAMAAMSKYVASRPDFRERMANSMKMTGAERRAQVESDPQAMAILKQNNLTSQDYLTGVPALRMALLAAQGMNGPTVVASPANVAFAKANLAQLKPKMDAANGATARR
jgi:hypothetical protein